MSALPEGTVAFLMTDIEASTSGWRRPDEMDDEMTRLEAALETSVGGSGGSLIKSRGEGDSAFTVFRRTSDAVVAAVRLQRALAGQRLRVRAAIHTGEARLRNDDYFGVAPNRTARLRSLAHGGQTVVSRVSAELAQAELPDEVHFFSLGTYRIRDWPRAETIYGVAADGIRSDFPPLHVLGDAQRAVMTVVAVDEAGSSATVRAMSEPDIVLRHRVTANALRSAFHEHRGSFIKMMGDGCTAAFDDPLNALRFARSVMCTTGLPLKIGIQTGLVDLVDDDLVGSVLYDAHNVERVANVGEIVVTRTVVDLTAGHEIEFAPRDDDLYAMT